MSGTFSRLESAYREQLRLLEKETDVLLFMVAIARRTIGDEFILRQLTSRIPRDDLVDLLATSRAGCLQKRNRALVIIFWAFGISHHHIAAFLQITSRGVRRIIQTYEDVGIVDLLRPRSKQTKLENRSDLQETIFSILHAPPSDYNINRTTWRIPDIKAVLDSKGFSVGKNTVSKIIRNAGYRRLKAREVLTSNDPDYKKKLRKITNILQHLGAQDRFFSIDEYGPFSVKQRSGRRLVPRGEYPTVPQYQDSKGFLIMTAALELSTNQITHFYSKKKDTEEMIKLLDVLMNQYEGCRRLYLSWDAASWHSSKKFLARVAEVNGKEFRRHRPSPIIKLAPLPARAQFLNVVESVFSGMATAIIHNSDYKSVDAAKNAIDRYVRERNEFFLRNPKRAGKKIWGDELVPARFSEGNVCKDHKRLNLASIR